MKIIIAAEIFEPDIGGPATYAKALALELVKADNKTAVLCYSDSYSDAPAVLLDGAPAAAPSVNQPVSAAPAQAQASYPFQIVRILRKRGKILRYLRYFFALNKLYEKGDLVYAQGAIGAGIPSLVFCIFKKIPYFLRVGGDYTWEQAMNAGATEVSVDEFNSALGAGATGAGAGGAATATTSITGALKHIKGGILKKLKFGVMRWLQIRVAQKANKMIVASRYLKSIVEKWGVKSEKILVMPSAISRTPMPLHISESDLSKSGLSALKSELKIEARRELGLPETAKIVLLAGRFVPWKGFETLIQMMPDLVQEAPEAVLALVGDGPTYEKCKRLADGLEWRNGRGAADGKIIFAGKKSREEVGKYYKAADVFILNSGYEGLSHILVEAMSSGIPIIASDIGGNREIIRNHENGILVPYNDQKAIKSAILSVFKDDKLARKLADGGHETAKNFDFYSGSFSMFLELIHSL